MYKAKINFLRSVSFYFISFIIFEFLFLISGTFSSSLIVAAKEDENHMLSFSLIGVIVPKRFSSAVAVLKDERKGKTILLTTGERILDIKLIHVFENRIILQRGGKTFQIFLGRSSLVRIEREGPKNSDKVIESYRRKNLLRNSQFDDDLKRMEFTRTTVKRRVDDEWPLIIKETRFVPNHTNGKISGFKITRLPKQSILSEIGIYKNDVIKEVNGIELNDMPTLFRLYNEFKDANQLEVTIERNGKLFRILYTLK